EKNKIEPNKNTTQELREYKQLLDDGIITEEEFNKKKNEILNR
ncbi:MAG: SHOCT domain-containing protein, partial [Clostridia bacterium]|nr:SHOCT domain-containing protein [Clostridia bacterium]